MRVRRPLLSPVGSTGTFPRSAARRVRHRAQVSERTRWEKKEKSVVRSLTFYGFFPLRFPLLIRFHTDKKRVESAVVKEAYLTKHVWLEKKKKGGGKNGVLGQGCVLLCLACRKTSLWVLSEAARLYELGGSLHLTVH